MNKFVRKIVNCILVLIELFILGLYIIPEYFDVNVDYDNFLVLFYFIIVIFIHSFIDFKEWTKGHIIFRFAFLFTLCADYLMTYLDSFYELSIIFFFFAQLSYFIFINYNFKNVNLKSSIIIYLSLVTTLIIIGSILELINLLTIIAIIYFSLSLTNIIYLLKIKNKGLKNHLFLLGLVLFLLCDTCIGLQNVGISNVKITDLFSHLVWIFYAPSQMILVLTLTNYYEKGDNYEKKDNKS